MAGEAFEELTLDDIADFRNGKAISPEKYSPEGRSPVFGANGQIARSNAVLNPEPVIAIGRVGAYCGSVYYISEPSWVTDNAIVAIPKKRNDLRFLYYLLGSLDLRRTAIGSAQPLMTQGGLKVVQTLVPPLKVQQAIACILGALDDKIELNRRMNRTLEAMARAIFKSWFVDFDPVRAIAAGQEPPGLTPHIAQLFPDAFDDSELGKIPKGWSHRKLTDEFTLTMGQSPPGTTYNEDGDGLPFFQGRRDFGHRYPTNRVYCSAPTRFANGGDTLVSVRAPVGDINMASERCCIGRGLSALRHKSGSRSYTYYAMDFAKEAFATFDAEGTVFGSISKKGFESIPIVAPLDDLVAKFETVVFPLDERFSVNEREIRLLTATRDTLLPKLISGELRVPGAERIVERCV